MYGRIKSYINVNDSDDDSNNDFKANKDDINTNNNSNDVNEDNNNNYDYDKTAFLKLKEKNEKIKLDKKNDINNSTLKLKEETSKSKSKKDKKDKKSKNGNEKIYKNENNEKMVEVQYCGLCNKRVNNKLEFEIHTASKKHNEKLRENTIQKLSNYDSVKSFLIDNEIIGRKKTDSNRIKQLLYTISLSNLINK